MADAGWHAESIDEALRSEFLQGGSERVRRGDAPGHRRLARTIPASAVRILVNQLVSVVIWLLGAAAVVTLACRSASAFTSCSITCLISRMPGE
jgi:hypothetical protein